MPGLFTVEQVAQIAQIVAIATRQQSQPTQPPREVIEETGRSVERVQNWAPSHMTAVVIQKQPGYG